ncbi:MAG TPA: valine--tRNA ligase [bacterium]|nr:valine--tRNA ligase [bacterium]
MTEFSKVYDFHEIEDKIYQKWESSGFFKPEVHPKGKPYCIIMPPPNITGKLHMGHAMFVAIQDLFIRYHRMKGEAVLWLPGTDHASIATQNVVEKEIKKENLTRHDLGREKFLERVWAWVDEYGKIITTQIRKLGASCDWSRERFTMDDRANKAVNHAFTELYRQKLIYKGKYLINWCPRCQTVLADDEVEHAESEAKLYTLSYPIMENGKPGEASISVATVRPETMIGDTAVAVHPDDPRYQDLVGKMAFLPVAEREIPIIADKRVDMEFGTGAVKITPAHDFNDYEIARHHNLPLINILTEEGRIREGMFGAGLDVVQARRKIIKTLRSGGYLSKEVNYSHSVGHCYRCDTTIEPYISTQWFVHTEALAARALQVVADGKIHFIPQRMTKIFNHWMGNLHDWCISRQLWWGHQIPAWYCQDCLEKEKARDAAELDYRVFTIVSDQEPASCPQCGGTRLERDPDTLDTWFSSGLWPFSTLGWPEETPDLKRFFPTQMMETGYDIIFFWVARMVLLSLGLMDDIPFKKVYLHGLVRDAHGEKMSKSKGNVVDPLEIIEEFGADALRLSFLLNVTPGNDIKFSQDKTVGYRNFCNKLWNATRFALFSKKNAFYEELHLLYFDESKLSLPDRWILSRLNQVIAQATRLLDGYRFGEAGTLLYEFVWNDFCDWYLEMSKSLLDSEDWDRRSVTQETILRVLQAVLKMLHPYIPFITEEIWQRIGSKLHMLADYEKSERDLITASWPKANKALINDGLETVFQVWRDSIQKIRNIRSEADLPPSAKPIVTIVFTGDDARYDTFKELEEQMIRLTPLKQVAISREIPQKDDAAIEFVISQIRVFVVFDKQIDRGKEMLRLHAELDDLEVRLGRLAALLANEQFVQNAPAEVVGRERKKMEELLHQKDVIEKQIERIKS